jgi:hypothetical protein
VASPKSIISLRLAVSEDTTWWVITNVSVEHSAFILSQQVPQICFNHQVKSQENSNTRFHISFKREDSTLSGSFKNQEGGGVARYVKFLGRNHDIILEKEMGPV